MNTQRAIGLCLGLAVLGFGADSAHAQAPGTTGVPGIDKFLTQGPERVMMMPVGICTRFLPTSAAPARSRGGLGWANGTGGTPGTYGQVNNATGVATGILGRVASYGTLVTAANTTNSGRGIEVSQCIDELANARPDSSGRFATAGHSQGGSGSINAAGLNSKVVVTCPVQLDGVFTATSSPANLRGTATGPALIMCGGADTLAPCTRANNGDTKFAQATVPVTRISVVNSPHVGAGSPTGNGGLYAALVTTCVEAALDGDPQAIRALQPGGAVNGAVLNRIESRNFPTGGGLDALAQLAAVIAALVALANLQF